MSITFPFIIDLIKLHISDTESMFAPALGFPIELPTESIDAVADTIEACAIACHESQACAAVLFTKQPDQRGYNCYMYREVV